MGVVAGHRVDAVADLPRDPGQVFACCQRPRHVGVSPAVERERAYSSHLRARAKSIPGAVEAPVVPGLAAGVAEDEVLAEAGLREGALLRDAGKLLTESGAQVHGAASVRLRGLDVAALAAAALAPGHAPLGQVHLLPAQRQQLALAGPAVQRGEDDRMEARRPSAQLEQNGGFLAGPGLSLALLGPARGRGLDAELADPAHWWLRQEVALHRPVERPAQQR